MNIDRVHLTRWCQHEDEDFEFSSGITGIVGQNGSGKSNLLEAIRYGFTGQSRLHGEKKANLTWGTALSGKVEIWFHANGKEGYIRRAIDKATCQLKYDGEKYTTATAVAENIYKVLGISQRVLNEVVFVSQGDIDELLFVTPGRRLQGFQRLCGVDGTNAIRDALLKEANSLVVSDFSDQISAIELRIEHDLNPSIEKLGIEVQRLTEELDGLDEEAARRVLNTRDAAATAERNKARLEAYIAELDAKISSTNTAASTTQVDISRVTGVVERERGTYEAAKRSTATAESLRKMELTRQSFLRELEKLEGEALNNRSPDPVAVIRSMSPEAQKMLDYDKDDIKPLLAELTGKAEVCKSVMRLSGSDPKCPVCNSIVSNIDELRESAAKRAGAIEADLKAIYEMRDAVRKLEEDRIKFDAWKRSYDARMQQLQVNLANLPPEQAVPSNEEIRRLEGLIGAYESAQSELSDYNQRHSALKAKSDSLVQERERQVVDLQSCNMEMSGAFSQENIAAAEQVVVKVRQLRDDLASRNGTLTAKVEELGKATGMLNELKEKQGNTEKLVEYRKLIEDARRVLHGDTLPTLVISHYLRGMNMQMSEYLRVFNANFIASIEDDLQIPCVSSDGHPFVAERLSGGQKVAMALAFHMSISRLFGDLGIIILDEPTVYLDDARVDCVTQLLQKAKENAVAGTQFIVSTHAPELSSAFDATISLG